MLVLQGLSGTESLAPARVAIQPLSVADSPLKAYLHTLPSWAMRMADVLGLLADATAPDRVFPGHANDVYSHDEALGAQPQRPRAVVVPTTTAEVAAIMRIASDHLIPVTPRGSGAGVSGAVIPRPDGIVVSFERMRRIEIDEENMVAVVQPGATLTEIDEIAAGHGLVYPVLPGEHGSSIGGNIGTNAGGSRAIRYGVTRHNVLGLEMVLASGAVLRSGGKFVKVSAGYDLTQLIVGSEGTLALVTEATLRLYPRLRHQSTVLAPFADLDGLMRAVPRIVATGIGMTTLEYIDDRTMRELRQEFGLRLGVADAVRDRAQAYLAVVMEGRHARRLDEEVQELAGYLAQSGAIEVYVLPPGPGRALLEAREKAFWLGKRGGVHDLVDVVVPRASICDFMAVVATIGAAWSAYIGGCGHAGDGNIHLSVAKEDPGERATVVREVLRAGLTLGGAISGEHGIGTTKREHFLALENPDKLDLLRRIKTAFDPNGILNRGVVLDWPAVPAATG
jgi:glycolate oxidase